MPGERTGARIRLTNTTEKDNVTFIDTLSLGVYHLEGFPVNDNIHFAASARRDEGALEIAVLIALERQRICDPSRNHGSYAR